MIDYYARAKPDFRINDGESSSVTFEHFAYIHGGIEVNTNRTLIFRSVSDCDLTFGPGAKNGKIFLEDFVTHNLALANQTVWARQLNVENEGTHVVNEAGHLWVLGYKTERGGTLLESRRGAQSEILVASAIRPPRVSSHPCSSPRTHPSMHSSVRSALTVTRSLESSKRLAAPIPRLSRGDGNTAPYSPSKVRTSSRTMRSVARRTTFGRPVLHQPPRVSVRLSQLSASRWQIESSSTSCVPTGSGTAC